MMYMEESKSRQSIMKRTIILSTYIYYHPSIALQANYKICPKIISRAAKRASFPGDRAMKKALLDRIS